MHSMPMFEIGVCPWPDLSLQFQYTSPTPVVSLHLIPRIQYHPGIPVTLLTGSSFTATRESTAYAQSFEAPGIHVNIFSMTLLFDTKSVTNVNAFSVTQKKGSKLFFSKGCFGIILVIHCFC